MEKKVINAYDSPPPKNELPSMSMKHNYADVLYFFPEGKEEGVMVYCYEGLEGNDDYLISSDFKDIKRVDVDYEPGKAVLVKLVDGERKEKVVIVSKEEMVRLLNLLKEAKKTEKNQINFKVNHKRDFLNKVENNSLDEFGVIKKNINNDIGNSIVDFNLNNINDDNVVKEDKLVNLDNDLSDSNRFPHHRRG